MYFPFSVTATLEQLDVKIGLGLVTGVGVDNGVEFDIGELNSVEEGEGEFVTEVGFNGKPVLQINFLPLLMHVYFFPE